MAYYLNKKNNKIYNKDKGKERIKKYQNNQNIINVKYYGIWSNPHSQLYNLSK